MRGVFLILAASAAVSTLPAPAGAESGGRSSFGQGASSHHRSGQFGSPNVRVHRGHPDRGHRDRNKFDEFASADGRDRNNRGDAYLPYRDYQGDSLWRSNSFNDWWHDRPDRAFPRWVANNQNCERQYYTGGGWRC